jgi:hypothetical protein
MALLFKDSIARPPRQPALLPNRPQYPLNFPKCTERQLRADRRCRPHLTDPSTRSLRSLGEKSARTALEKVLRLASGTGVGAGFGFGSAAEACWPGAPYSLSHLTTTTSSPRCIGRWPRRPERWHSAIAPSCQSFPASST